MNYFETDLPSNRKFGLFFATIFCMGACYFYFRGAYLGLTACGTLFLVFSLTSLLNDKLLEPLNRIWMRFGYLLSKIFSPIVMGVIFFFLFTPSAIVIRVLRRDELRLRWIERDSYWRAREKDQRSAPFKLQF